MNASHLARTAYAPANSAVRTPRSIEYQALARVTARLKAAASKPDAPFSEIATALHDNRRLWMEFATLLADDANGLPDELRAGLLSLADFTLRHSSKVLAGKGAVAPLIEINAAVMRGLRQQQVSP